MPLYLDADLLKDAVERLRSSRASTRVLEFLIFRRALVLAGGPPQHVTTGMGAPHFQQAIEEWARIRPAASSEQHFFNPFGTAGTTDNGFRNDKYPSNGASDTVARWGNSLSNPPFKRVPATSPMDFSYNEVPAAALDREFLRDPQHAKPKLSDVAIWWLRSRDLDGEGLDTSAELSDLIDIFREEVGLTTAEVDGLFDTSLT